MKLDPKTFAKILIDFLRPTPTKVIHNNNHTIILFDDGSKTVTKPNGDEYDPYIGFCVAMTAKYFGGKKAAHQAYESLSGCKYGTQPEQVAGLAEKIARATENMNKLAEAFREANTVEIKASKIDTTSIKAEGGRFVSGETTKQTEPKPVTLRKLETCLNCKHFPVWFNLDPCKTCKETRINGGGYFALWEPNVNKNEQNAKEGLKQ